MTLVACSRIKKEIWKALLVDFQFTIYLFKCHIFRYKQLKKTCEWTFYSPYIHVYPFNIPDLSLGCPLVVSGRYEGKFQGAAKARGCLAETSDVFIDLKVQNAK